MNQEKLYKVVCCFKNAILAAKENGEFSSRDVMHRFPHGCCEFASDLLAYYLLEVHKIETIHINGVYDADNPENITNHEWLIHKNLIIDITYSQFRSDTGSDEDIYVGTSNDFFKSMTDVHPVEFYDIQQNSTLRDDYQKILYYL